MSAFPESASLAQGFGALAEAVSGKVWRVPEYGGGEYVVCDTTGRDGPYTEDVCHAESEEDAAFIAWVGTHRAAILYALHLAKLVDEACGDPPLAAVAHALAHRAKAEAERGGQG